MTTAAVDHVGCGEAPGPMLPSARAWRHVARSTRDVRAALAVLGAAMLLVTAGPAMAYEVTEVKGGGVLAGTVRFTGRPPRTESLALSAGRGGCADGKPAEALVVGADGGVKGGVVMIEAVPRGKKPAGEVLLDTRACAFVGHVSTLMAGERARVKNSDPVVHHALGVMGTRTIFNVALPEKDQVIDITRRLQTPGVVRVRCAAHRTMAAWIVVHDSPYVAVTDERGAFRIDGVPPGRYRVALWHEGFRRRGGDKDGRPVHEEPRTITRTVTIAPGATAVVDFELR